MRLLCKGEQENKIDMIITNDIRLYQIEMDGVDQGDQHRVMGVGFTNVSHFENGIRKCH